jgi:hypothetical protein
MIPSSGVMAFVGMASLGSQDHSLEPHPVVGGAVCPSHRAYLDSGLPYLSSSPGGAVLSTWRGVEMAFVRTEGIVVPSVLAE